jgi:hypothetical protein
MIAVISFICRPSVLLPAPDEGPAVNGLSRSGPVLGRVIKALKMNDISRILALCDSKTGRLYLPVFHANCLFCIFFNQY